MNLTLEAIEKELKASQDRRSTSNRWDSAYSAGIEFALNKLKEKLLPVLVKYGWE